MHYNFYWIVQIYEPVVNYLSSYKELMFVFSM